MTITSSVFRRITTPGFLLGLCASSVPARDYWNETAAQRDARLKWWREARFGLFIHWGLYAIPAGEWNGQTNHAERQSGDKTPSTNLQIHIGAEALFCES